MCSQGDNLFEHKELYENIYGKRLQLNIVKHRIATEITVHKLEKNRIQLKSLLISLLVLTTIVFLLRHLINVIYFLPLFIIVIGFTWSILNDIEHEKLLYVPAVGCQISIKYSFGFFTKFIPAKSIQGIFINEVLSKHRVLFMLSMNVKDDKREFIIPLLTGTKPRLTCLQLIYENLLN